MKSKTGFIKYKNEINYHANTKCIYKDDYRMIYEVDGVDGGGVVEVLEVFPNVFLQLLDFNCKAFRLTAKSDVNAGLKISYAIDGRTEIHMSDNLRMFMAPGTLSLDVRTSQDVFRFPSGHYNGVEIFLQESAIAKALPEVWQLYGIEPQEIKQRFCRGDQNYTICADERLRSLFLALKNPPSECKPTYLKIKVTELLFLLQYCSLPDEKRLSLMTIGQIEIAKQIMEIISEDLARHHTIESLAPAFGVSATSLKNYFQGVYGKNISTYLREARMSKAANALRDSTSKVAEIALLVGYQNASKFSATFKSVYGETPLEYRRKSRCGISSTIQWLSTFNWVSWTSKARIAFFACLFYYADNRLGGRAAFKWLHLYSDIVYLSCSAQVFALSGVGQMDSDDDESK